MARPANDGESPHFPEMVEGCPAGYCVPVGKGSTNRSNRAFLRETGRRSGIMHKAMRGHALTLWRRLFDRLVSRDGRVVERGSLKRRFGARARYMTRAKVEAK